MNEQQIASLTGRVRKEGKYSTSMLNCISATAHVGKAFEEKRAAIMADKHLSDVGRRAKAAELAKATVKDVLTASKPQRTAMAQAIGGRSDLKPKPVASEDARGELRRSEVRAYVRGLPADKRISAAMDLASDDEALNALLDAHPQLSGLSADQHGHLLRAYTERHHGARLAELDGIESDATAAGAAVEMVMNELRHAAGLPEHAFAEHVKAVQAEVDKGW